MQIALQVADLDYARIDGTRVYIREMLARFAALGAEDTLHLYHRGTWNPELAPPPAPNYQEHRVAAPFWWTQTRFAAELLCLRPDALWMPMQALPLLRPRGMRTTVTIHDLAFKVLPETFPVGDRRRLNLFTDYAVTHADRLIAVSAATKADLLRFYPTLAEERVTVVHHGFDADLCGGSPDDGAVAALRARYGLADARYILAVGGLQPRKNIAMLVAAFDILAARDADLRLVVVGGKAWLWEETLAAIARSPYRARIVTTGAVSFRDLATLYHGAHVLAYPSLYEGFGIVLLEGFAAGVPVVTGDSAALVEIAGDAALTTDVTDATALAAQIGRACDDTALRAAMIARGHARLGDFSWDRCAAATYDIITSRVA